jgi:hypothetical protein
MENARRNLNDFGWRCTACGHIVADWLVRKIRLGQGFPDFEEMILA